MEKQLERDLINYLYFELNRLRFFIYDEIFEYDIQSFIHQFLKIKFINTKLKVKREKNKIDHVIQQYDGENKLLRSTVIEVKSYIKSHERINLLNISKDVVKLKNRIPSSYSEGYFILVIKEAHLKSKKGVLIEFLTSLNGKKKVYNFNTSHGKIKSRIIRSVKTTYSESDKNSYNHKSQVRVFMFQVL